VRGPEYRRDASGNYEWYVYDGLGSVIGTLDANGNIISTRKYDVYGAIRGSSGPSGTRHKFVGKLGHPSDDETGLIYMRARYMDPVTGRCESEDPACNGINWYVYANCNPVRSVDPTGKASVESWIAFGIGVAFAMAALAQMGLYYWHPEASIGYIPNAPMQIGRLSSAIALASAAVAWFGLAAVGMVNDPMVNYITAGVLAAEATLVLLLKSTEAGMRTAAWAAVSAAFFYSLVLLGWEVSIGADTE